MFAWVTHLAQVAGPAIGFMQLSLSDIFDRNTELNDFPAFFMGCLYFVLFVLSLFLFICSNKFDPNAPQFGYISGGKNKHFFF